jgi:glutamate decarboxylase
LSEREGSLSPIYGSIASDTAVLRYALPERPMSPDAAYNLIRDELALDGNSRLNLATFVTTWMEPQARQLINDTLDKNMVDRDEYPKTAESRALEYLEGQPNLRRRETGVHFHH